MTGNSAPYFFSYTRYNTREKDCRTFLGNNFLLECPTDLRTTPLSYIFYALFKDTSLGHFCRTQPNSQIAKLAKYLDIWLFGYLAARKNHARVGYP